MKILKAIVRRIISYIVENVNGIIIYYNNKSQTAEVLDLISKIKKETETLLKDNEAYHIYATTKKTKKIVNPILVKAERGLVQAPILRLVFSRPVCHI